MRLRNLFMHGLGKKAFTFPEMLAVVLIMSTLIAMSYAIFLTGQGVWATSESKIRLQENLRLVLQRVAVELRQTNLAQQHIFDGTGVHGTDSIRFSIPVICENGGSLLDSQGNVNHWGAPLTWGCASYSCMDADNKCSTVEYKFLEFRLNVQNQLVRMVLDNDLIVKRTDVIAQDIKDFQVSLNGTLITLTVVVEEKALNNRVLTATASQNVYLRN